MVVDDLTDLRLAAFGHPSVGWQMRELGFLHGSNGLSGQILRRDRLGGALLDLLHALVIFGREKDHRRTAMSRHRHRFASSDVSELADAFLEFAGIYGGHGVRPGRYRLPVQ